MRKKTNGNETPHLSYEERVRPTRPSDPVAFMNARVTVLSEGIQWEGIGTLSEKTLHKILKLYVDPDASHHEVEYMGSVLDVKSSDGIFEIQTRNYDKLLPKLKKLLPHERVTVVCPLATEKSIRWVDKDTGEISTPKKSPKREGIFDAFKMLFGIREVIKDKNLCVRVLFMSVEDYRNLDGYGKDRKKRSTRMERIPCDILFETDLTTSRDYAAYLPDEVGEEFVAAELARAIKRSSRYTYYILKLLVCAGAICESGHRGRAVVYKRLI